MNNNLKSFISESMEYQSARASEEMYRHIRQVYLVENTKEGENDGLLSQLPDHPYVVNKDNICEFMNKESLRHYLFHYPI